MSLLALTIGCRTANVISQLRATSTPQIVEVAAAENETPKIAYAVVDTLTPTSTTTTTATPRPTGTPTRRPTVVPTKTPTKAPTATTTALAALSSSKVPALNIDKTSRELGVKVIETSVTDNYWKVTKVRYFGPDDYPHQNAHDIFVRVEDSAGNLLYDVPIKVFWAGGPPRILSSGDKKDDPQALYWNAVFNMDSTGCSYSVEIIDGKPSDKVLCLGMGTVLEPWRKIHNSYDVTFRWVP